MLIPCALFHLVIFSVSQSHLLLSTSRLLFSSLCEADGVVEVHGKNWCELTDWKSHCSIFVCALVRLRFTRTIRQNKSNQHTKKKSLNLFLLGWFVFFSFFFFSLSWSHLFGSFGIFCMCSASQAVFSYPFCSLSFQSFFFCCWSVV